MENEVAEGETEEGALKIETDMLSTLDGIVSGKKIKGEGSAEFLRFLYALKTGDVQELKLLRTHDICGVFGLSPAALKTRLCKKPESLPKPFTFPGSRILYWTPESVAKFISVHAGTTFPPVPPEETTAPRRKRGRPSYVERGLRKPVSE